MKRIGFFGLMGLIFSLSVVSARAEINSTVLGLPSGTKNVTILKVGKGLYIDTHVGVIASVFDATGELIQDERIQLSCRAVSAHDFHLTVGLVEGPDFRIGKPRSGKTYRFFYPNEKLGLDKNSLSYSADTCSEILRKINMTIFGQNELVEILFFEIPYVGAKAQHSKYFLLPEPILPAEISHDNSLSSGLGRFFKRFK